MPPPPPTPSPCLPAADHYQPRTDAHINPDDEDTIYETALFPQKHTVRRSRERLAQRRCGNQEGRNEGKVPPRRRFVRSERVDRRTITGKAKRLDADFTSHSNPFTPTPPLLSHPQLHILLYEHVLNASEIRTALLDGTLPEFALINPNMVLSSFHILLAASTALLQQAQGTMRLKTLHAELLYSLSPTTNISEAFCVFGGGGAGSSSSNNNSSSSSSSTPLLFAFIGSSKEVIREKVIPLVQGKAVAAERVIACLDARPLSNERIERFRKVFKVEKGGREGRVEEEGEESRKVMRV